MNSSSDVVSVARSSMTKPTVLAVDDSLIVHTLVRRTLEDLYNVVTTADPVEALSMIYHQPIDLLLLDVSMPNLNGLELCRILRSLPQFAALPVLMLTSHDRPFDRIQGQLAGATEYITKPFDRDALRSLVAHHTLDRA
ncbi:MAG: response regulator [Limnothrix sp. BL-A-16]|jgi:twitching motility two-component system response regulator PilG